MQATARVRHIMPEPFKHPKSGVYYYRKTVPESLRGALGRREIRRSLGTKDLREAKLRYPEVAADVDAILTRAAGGATRLTNRQIVALAGEWYRRELTKHEDDPGRVTEDPAGAEETQWAPLPHRRCVHRVLHGVGTPAQARRPMAANRVRLGDGHTWREMMTGEMSLLAIWFLRNFPILQSIG